jgi:hypothetical protein
MVSAREVLRSSKRETNEGAREVEEWLKLTNLRLILYALNVFLLPFIKHYRALIMGLQEPSPGLGAAINLSIILLTDFGQIDSSTAPIRELN